LFDPQKIRWAPPGGPRLLHIWANPGYPELNYC
jgi:hypothetical protein